jgi:hypothetical protein
MYGKCPSPDGTRDAIGWAANGTGVFGSIMKLLVPEFSMPGSENNADIRSSVVGTASGKEEGRGFRRMNPFASRYFQCGAHAFKISDVAPLPAKFYKRRSQQKTLHFRPDFCWFPAPLVIKQDLFSLSLGCNFAFDVLFFILALILPGFRRWGRG